MIRLLQQCECINATLLFAFVFIPWLITKGSLISSLGTEIGLFLVGNENMVTMDKCFVLGFDSLINHAVFTFNRYRLESIIVLSSEIACNTGITLWFNILITVIWSLCVILFYVSVRPIR